jgi:hypothetical protein
MLLEHGADINARTNDRSAPLLMAAKYGKIEFARALLEHGANVGTEDEGGRTPLHEATREWNVELVRMLLEHSADVNARTKDNWTPLLMAAENGSVEVVHALLEHGANVGTEGEEGWTPITRSDKKWECRARTRDTRAWRECGGRGQERENLIPDCVGEGILRYCGTTVKSRCKGRVLCEH